MSKHTSTIEIINRETEFVSKFSKIPYASIVLESGSGVMLSDFDGKSYIDFLSSASSSNLGHGNPQILAAVIKQMEKLTNYTSAYFYTEPVGRLAEELALLAPGDIPKKVAFGLSGSDAIDGMIKLARGFTNRPKIISFIGSYHGSTLGAISLSAISTEMKRKIGPLIPEIYHFMYPTCFRCPYNMQESSCNLDCLEQIENAFKSYLPAEEVAAIVIEPIAGDAGLVVPPIEFMKGLKKLCDLHGILFVVDEIQQALGRTGKWFSIEHFNIIPDIIVMGKSLGAGLPLSAIIARSEIMDCLLPPAHLFTMSGNATACSAAIEQIRLIKELALLEKSKEMGDYLHLKLLELKEQHSIIGDVRGLGLSIGVELINAFDDRTPNNDAAVRICCKCIDMGLLLIYVGKSTLRIQPPLIIEKHEIDEALKILKSAIIQYEFNEINDSELKNIVGW